MYYKQHNRSNGSKYPWNLPSNFILHINYSHAHFDENTRSLLTYTDIAICILKLFNTGMDKTCVYTSFYGFICVSGTVSRLGTGISARRRYQRV